MPVLRNVIFSQWRSVTSYSSDVAQVLCYLGSPTPLIIHQHHTFNDVLFTHNLPVKIAYLDMASVFNLTLLQINHVTQTPGILTYMPSEVIIENSKFMKF